MFRNGFWYAVYCDRDEMRVLYFLALICYSTSKDIVSILESIPGSVIPLEGEGQSFFDSTCNGYTDELVDSTINEKELISVYLALAFISYLPGVKVEHFKDALIVVSLEEVLPEVVYLAVVVAFLLPVYFNTIAHLDIFLIKYLFNYGFDLLADLNVINLDRRVNMVYASAVALYLFEMFFLKGITATNNFEVTMPATLDDAERKKTDAPNTLPQPTLENSSGKSRLEDARLRKKNKKMQQVRPDVTRDGLNKAVLENVQAQLKPYGLFLSSDYYPIMLYVFSRQHCMFPEVVVSGELLKSIFDRCYPNQREFSSNLEQCFPLYISAYNQLRKEINEGYLHSNNVIRVHSGALKDKVEAIYFEVDNDIRWVTANRYAVNELFYRYIDPYYQQLIGEIAAELNEYKKLIEQWSDCLTSCHVSASKSGDLIFSDVSGNNFDSVIADIEKCLRLVSLLKDKYFTAKRQVIEGSSALVDQLLIAEQKEYATEKHVQQQYLSRRKDIINMIGSEEYIEQIDCILSHDKSIERLHRHFISFLSPVIANQSLDSLLEFSKYYYDYKNEVQQLQRRFIDALEYFPAMHGLLCEKKFVIVINAYIALGVMQNDVLLDVAVRPQVDGLREKISGLFWLYSSGSLDKLIARYHAIKKQAAMPPVQLQAVVAVDQDADADADADAVRVVGAPANDLRDPAVVDVVGSTLQIVRLGVGASGWTGVREKSCRSDITLTVDQAASLQGFAAESHVISKSSLQAQRGFIIRYLSLLNCLSHDRKVMPEAYAKTINFIWGYSGHWLQVEDLGDKGGHVVAEQCEKIIATIKNGQYSLSAKIKDLGALQADEGSVSYKDQQAALFNCYSAALAGRDARFDRCQSLRQLIIADLQHFYRYDEQDLQQPAVFYEALDVLYMIAHRLNLLRDSASATLSYHGYEGCHDYIYKGISNATVDTVDCDRGILYSIAQLRNQLRHDFLSRDEILAVLNEVVAFSSEIVGAPADAAGAVDAAEVAFSSCR